MSWIPLELPIFFFFWEKDSNYQLQSYNVNSIREMAMLRKPWRNTSEEKCEPPSKVVIRNLINYIRKTDKIKSIWEKLKSGG